MPRPKKHRTCECRMAGQVYKPAGIPMDQLQRISLGQDELEALRLCDLEGLSQEQAGVKMNVSRGTVQRLLVSARRKTASALVGGYALLFEDGG